MNLILMILKLSSVFFLLGTIMNPSTLATPITSPLTEKLIEYSDGKTTFEGFLVMPSHLSKTHLAPGVLVIHNWLGVTEETKSKVRALAKLGYVGFAADVYGKGIRPTQPVDAGKLALEYKTDRTRLRAHLNLALQTLKKIEGVDLKRIAATGYCFGGTSALELARSGADLRGVVSFHGGLDSPDPNAGKNIKGKVLALHGADDPWVPDNDVRAFESEMRENKVDWQLVKFGGTVHSFTDKTAGNDPSKGAAYHASADARSWEMMKAFLAEVFH